MSVLEWGVVVWILGGVALGFLDDFREWARDQRDVWRLHREIRRLQRKARRD